MSASQQPCLLIGISGPSSSGKTTLSRLLRDILPRTFILHEDDFYLPDGQIPVTASGLQDWDCIESLDLPAFRSALEHIREHGAPPPDLVSKEDQNAVGESGVSPELVQLCRRRVEGMLEEAGAGTAVDADALPRIAIIDGFLLFAEAMKEIRELFHVRLFLRTNYETAKTRRERRQGYVTLEGFWEDPPGYVDQIVWPNYVKDHRFLFENGDVDGKLDAKVCKEVGVMGMPEGAMGSMAKCLEWAVGALEPVLKGLIKQKKNA